MARAGALLILALVLAGCEPPAARWEGEVPLSVFQGPGLPLAPAQGDPEPLGVRVYLYRSGQQVWARLWTGGASPPGGAWAWFWRGPGGRAWPWPPSP
jgi:hypothetical protein